MDFYDVVRRRRIVRSFSDAPVAADALERIVDVGRRGPSAGFSQGVEFVVVTDPEVRAAVSVPRDELRVSGFRGFVEQAPALIVVCTSADMYRRRYEEEDKVRARAGAPDEELWRVPYWYTDAGAAMMLILLAAVREGLAAGVAGVMGADGQERVQRVLGMPPDYTAVAVVAIGHEAGDAKALRGSARSRRRRAIDDVVHRERW